ncbi:MAG: protein kinase [bacterium]|nr:protein kinase [bacterium]
MPTTEQGPADLDLRPGTILCEQWRVERELGRGGFGVVFAAEDLHLGDTHALKVLDPAMAAKEKIVERFRREVLVMRKLTHPHVARVFDYREDPDHHLALISMEYIPGPSLRDLIALAKREGKQIPVPIALAVLAQTLAALAAAHDQGVIHRDVKPGNILLAGSDLEELIENREQDPQVKLVDFGIASLLDRSGGYHYSRPLGTVAYAAPELLTDPPAKVTTAADVYGAGAVAYELLTQELPLGHGSPPSQLCAQAPVGLDEFLFGLLHRSASQRPTASGARSEAESLRTAAIAGGQVDAAETQHGEQADGRTAPRPARFLMRQLLPVLLVLSLAVILGPGRPDPVPVPRSGPASEAGSAEWVARGSHLSGGTVRTLVIDPLDPSTVYAGTAEGEVLKSINGGEAWDSATSGLPRKRVHALAVDPETPDILYAGTSGGVFESTNGAASWRALDLGVPRKHVHALAMDHQHPGTLYAGTSGGVFRSTNAGRSWKAVTRGMSRSNVTALAIDAATSTVYAGTSGGVFKSTDRGDHWSLVETGLTESFVQSLAVDPGPPSALYAGTWGGGVFASTDGGENWTAFNTGLVEESVSKVFSLAVDSGPPSVLYAGTSRGIFTHAKTDGKWLRLSCSPGRGHKDILALAVDSMHFPILYAGTRDGLFQCEMPDRRHR